MTKRLVLLALLAVAVAAFFASGLHRHVDVESLRGLLQRSGAWGRVIFVLLFPATAFGVPGLLFILSAIALWPPWQAFLLCWTGAVLAAVVGFAYARTIGRDLIAERLPERMRRFEAQVVERGLRTVIVIRLLFYISPPAHWALGLSPVGFGTYLLGTAIGLAPGVALWTFASGSVAAWYAGRATRFWLDLTGLLVIGGLGYALWRRARRAPVAPPV